MYGIFSELNRLEFISIGKRRVRDVKEVIKEPFLSDCSVATLAVPPPETFTWCAVLQGPYLFWKT